MELSRYRRALVIVLGEIVFDIIGKLLHFSFCFNNSLSLSPTASSSKAPYPHSPSDRCLQNRPLFPTYQDLRAEGADSDLTRHR